MLVRLASPALPLAALLVTALAASASAQVPEDTLSAQTPAVLESPEAVETPAPAPPPIPRAAPPVVPKITVSLIGGYADLATSYTPADSLAAPFLLSGSGLSAAFTTDAARLSVSYLSADRDSVAGNGSSALSVDLTSGGNAMLLDGISGIPVSVFVPIRVAFGYQSLARGALSAGPGGALDDGPGTYHLGRAGLGLGVGGKVHLDLGLPVLNSLVGIGSYVVIPGALADFSAEGGIVGYPQRTTDLTLEARAERVVGDRLGFTIGYTLRTVSWKPEKISGIEPLLDAVTGAGDFQQLTQQNLLRLGINW